MFKTELEDTRDNGKDSFRSLKEKDFILQEGSKCVCICIGGGCMFQGVRKKEGKNKRHRQKYRKERRTFCYERRKSKA